MGMSVVGLGLFGLGIVLGIFYLLMPDLAEVTRASVINGFAFGGFFCCALRSCRRRDLYQSC